jgi:hypothetical protein
MQVKRAGNLNLYHFDRAYEPGTACYAKILDNFGQDIQDENGQIDRRKLGAKVFGSTDLLHQLEHLVWPEILQMVKNDVKRLSEENGKKIIILDAAVLLQGTLSIFSYVRIGKVGQTLFQCGIVKILPVLPGSLARLSGPAVLPSSLALQSCPAVLPFR